MPIRYLVGGIIALGIIGAGIFLASTFFGSGQEPPVLSEEGGALFQEYTSQTLEQYKGTPVVANAWAIWCPFCVEELDDFATVQREFGDQVVMLAINRQESPADIRDFLQEIGVAPDDLTFLLDPDDSFYRKELNGFSMPETLFIDREGNVRFHKRGPMNEEEIRQRVQEIL